MFGVCVCVCFVYLHHFYQYYLCFTEEPSLTASNQQMNNLQVNIFEKKRHSGKQIFDITELLI